MINSSVMNDKKIFEYFVTIFYVHYTSLMDIFKMESHLKRRSTLIVHKLRSVLQILDSDLKDIDLKARESAKLYEKSIYVRTKADPKLNKEILFVIKSSNNHLLEIGVNSQSLFEVKHRYDKENNLQLVIEVRHNSQVIQEIIVIESDISGKVGLKTTIDCGSDPIIIFLKWMLDENSCEQHLDDPLLLATYFSTVLLELGVDYWTYFRIPFKVMAQHMDSQVRQMIYSSLHEMAFILNKTEKLDQLVPLFITYLKEVTVFDTNYFQNCIVFFDDIHPLDRLEVLSSLRPLLEDKSELNLKLKRVMTKKLIKCIDDFDINQIREHLITFTMDLLDTNEDTNDSKIFLKLFSICANKLFPKDKSDINDNDIEELVDNQIQFLNNTLERLVIGSDDNTLLTICHQLVIDGILSDKNYNKIMEQLK